MRAARFMAALFASTSVFMLGSIPLAPSVGERFAVSGYAVLVMIVAFLWALAARPVIR